MPHIRMRSEASAKARAFSASSRPRPSRFRFHHAVEGAEFTLGRFRRELLLNVGFRLPGEALPKYRVAEQVGETVPQRFGFRCHKVRRAVVEYLCVGAKSCSKNGGAGIQVGIDLHRSIKSL